MDSPSLGQAVAQVLRSELAARRINGPTFAAMVRESKANAWRKVEGYVKISFDDLDRYAAALGLGVDDIVAKAVAIQRDGSVYQPTPEEAEIAEGMGSVAQDVVEAESRKLRRRRPDPKSKPKDDGIGRTAG